MLILAVVILSVLLAGVGAAVDLGRAASEKFKIQSALDSAIIMGVSAASSSIKNGGTSAAAVSAAKSAANKYLVSVLGTSENSTINFTVEKSAVKGTGTITTSVKTSIMAIVGKTEVPISAASTVQSGLTQYLDVYLLVDVSASMLLPSTASGIQQMRNSASGCALACHDSSSGNDTYAYALKNNIQLRYQVVNLGVNNLLKHLSSNSEYTSKVKVGLWAFDHEIKRYTDLTSQYSDVSKKFPEPSLAVNEEAAATPFDSLIPSFVKTVGAGGDGSTAASAKKLVIIATDGVNDPTRAWTWNTSLRPQVRVFDTGFCKSFEANNVTVAIIYTPYFPMPWDWGYNATLGQPGSLGGATRVDDIPIALQKCAGTNFVEASDVSDIENSFTTIFKNASPIRLTS